MVVDKDTSISSKCSIYKIYDNKMYTSDKILNGTRPSLPPVHAFERCEVKECRPIEDHIEIKVN